MTRAAKPGGVLIPVPTAVVSDGSMVVDWAIIEIGFCVGVALSILATVLYVRAAGRHRREAEAAEAGSGVQPPVQPSSSD